MKKKTPTATVKPPAIKRLVDAYRKLAAGNRFTGAERVEFARMADAWAAELARMK